MKYICALITVSDIKRSRDFYENILNQKVATDFGENVSFEGGFAIHLKSHYQGLIGDKTIVEQVTLAFEMFEANAIRFVEVRFERLEHRLQV